MRAYICAQCKGVRRLCGRSRCPILERIRAHIDLYALIDFDNLTTLDNPTPPSIVVGEYGWPKVSVSLNVSATNNVNVRELDSPEEWWGKRSIEDIIRFRSMLISSTSKFNVKQASNPNRLLSNIQEAVLSTIPIEVEVEYEKPPKPRLLFDGIVEPVGPSGPIKYLTPAENPRTLRVIERIIYDYDVKASNAIFELYTHGVSLYHIIRLLSVGLLGRLRDRRIVPTRWSITAVDATISSHLLSKVKEFKEIGEIRVYHTEYIGNRYAIIMIPGCWTFEMIEVWLPRTIWVREEEPYFNVIYELYDGKVRGPMDGGYYAIRLPILEYLYKVRRQASVIAIRVVTKDYYAPLGVWAVRESIRNALKSEPKIFDDFIEALRYASMKVGMDFKLILKRSYVAKNILFQKKLIQFLS